MMHRTLVRIEILSTFFVLLTIAIPFNASFAEVEHAEITGPITTIIPLNDKLSIEKTIMALVIPEDNILPWAFVEGKIENPSPDYPVIIQFFNDESADNPMHVAQTDINDDGTYEYKFRVRDVNIQTGQTINIFEGTYTVKVFKVITSAQNSFGLA